MDLDALRRTAQMLAGGDATDAVDSMPTIEDEFDDMVLEPSAPEAVPGATLAEDEPEPAQPAGAVIDDELLAQILGREIDRAESNLESMDEERELAYAYYFGKLPAQPAKDRSKVVSKDVADMVEAMLSQVLQAFAGPDIAHFPPVSEEDEDQANEESSYLNWVFTDDCDGQYILYSAFKESMIQSIGIAKAYWDQRTRITFDEYHDLMPMELEQALAPRHNGERVEVVGYEDGAPQQLPVDPTQAQMMQQMGLPPPEPQTVQTVSLRVRRRWTEEKPALALVEAGDFLFDATHTSLFLEDIPFCAERRILTESDLLDLGFDEEQVRNLPSYEGQDDVSATSKSGLKPYREEEHRSTRPIEVYECYYLIDRDGDGFAERIKAFWSNQEILSVEECDSVPYALACPFPVPNEVIGESVFDKVRQVQDTKTALLRIAIDNALVNTFGRYEVEERMVNLNDLLTPVPGGAVRSKRIGSVAALAMANVGDAPMNLMQYMDKVRTEGAGPALDMQRENLPVNVSTAHGTERVMSAMEQLVTRMAQSYADTFVSELFRLLHKLLMKHGKGELTARMPGGKFLVTNPRNWRERERVTISIGKTQGERLRAIQYLNQIFQYQGQIMQFGGDGVMVDLSKMHNALIDMGRAMSLPSPEQYWIDPASPQAQQSLQQKQQAAQQQLQQQQQQMQMLLQMQLQLQQMQEETKRMNAQLDAQRALSQTKVNADVAREKVAADAMAKQADLMQSGMQHAEDNAVKLTDMELKYATQADQQYQENVRATSQRPTQGGR